MLNLLAKIDGKKTYTLAIVLGVITVALYLAGDVDTKEALIGVISAGIIAALRDAIKKVEEG